MSKFQLNEKETYGQYANRLADHLKVDKSSNIRERVVSDIVDMIARRDMINSIENDEFDVVQTRNTFNYVRRDS